MEELPKTMIKEVLTPEELNRLLPAALRPVENLRSSLYEATYPFTIRRLSAFPRFATSQSELMEMREGSSKKERNYREAFVRFCQSIAAETRCLAHQRRYNPRDTVYSRLAPTNITQELAIGLAEEDAIDIVLPEMEIALIGHDDFGCNVLVPPGNTTAFPWIERHASNAALHLLAVPGQ